MAAVLADASRAETAALILADAVLARALGWDHLLPLLSVAVTPRDLRLPGDALRLACHLAVVAGAGQAVPLAADLARRAADVGGRVLDTNAFDLAVLAAIAYHQPIRSDGLKAIFARDIRRDLIAAGPCELHRGAPCSFVTTATSLLAAGWKPCATSTTPNNRPTRVCRLRKTPSAGVGACGDGFCAITPERSARALGRNQAPRKALG